MPDDSPRTLHYVGIFCDAPGCAEDTRHDIAARSVPDAYRRARLWLMENAGWSRVRTDDGVWLDLCPTHTAAQTKKEAVSA